MENKIKTHADICKSLHNTYIAKNSDYGDSFSKVRREYDNVIIIHLMEKIERLKMLYNKDYEAKVNESIDDTLLDLANYCIMELLERRNEEQKSSKPIFVELPKFPNFFELMQKGDGK